VKKIALIACSNGYGHIRRLLLLAHALSNKGANPVLFAPLNAVESVVKSEGIIRPKIVDFDTHTNQESWLNGTATDWINFAPNFSGFDIVISDNLIEILLVRPDAWLSGSFFWHESLNNFPENLKLQELSLLRKYKPRMISSKIFTSDAVKNCTTLFEVGVYSQKNHTINQMDKKDALIACGKGGSIKRQAEEFVKLLATKEKTKFRQVWVDPDILPYKYPKWMVPATFTHKMYQSILVAVIRPGVGTVTNSILSKARVFPFFERDNKEMKLNAVRIQLYGIGENTHTIDNAWYQAELFMSNKKNQAKHFKQSQRIDIDGAQQAADIILKST
jgi:hypothetical protein